MRAAPGRPALALQYTKMAGEFAARALLRTDSEPEMRNTPYHHSRRRALPWLILGLLTLLSPGAWAADINSPNSAAEVDAPAVINPSAIPADQPKQCYSGCQSWGQMCNVDPRGVYKCQRRCERFGEICE